MATPTHDQHTEERNRLPTLMEVLGRRTLAPVDLFSFYIYMRDQQRSVDYLDFWLDVSQHMSLCRHYVRELRRSMLVDTPEMEKTQSKRSSQLLENFGDVGDNSTALPPASAGDKDGQEQRVSAFLRSENEQLPASEQQQEQQEQHEQQYQQKPGPHDSGPAEHSPAHSYASQQSGVGAGITKQSSSHRPSPQEKPPRPSFMSTPEVRTDSNSPGHTVARADIRASAEKILYTFVLPDAERAIILPEHIMNRIIRAIEEEGRDDPEVFDDAKDYVFQAMERDAFPGFLAAKAFGNLVPLSVLLRLGLGLTCFGGGFWGGFYMILTDQPRHIRCWLILPFTLGAYFLTSYQYKLDLVTTYAGYSEYTWMNYSRIRESFVRKLLLQRASMSFILFAAVAVALSVLFIFVPGTNF